jgi:hypothetical protein
VANFQREVFGLPRLLLLVGPTRRKATDHPQRVVAGDFATPQVLAAKRALLAPLARPALDFYTGNQMPGLRAGFTLLQTLLGPGAVDLRLISPAFGLVRHDEPLVPYDVDLAPMGPRGARDWMAARGVPAQVQAVVATAPLTVLALGEKYLRTLTLPVLPPAGGRVVALVKPDWVDRVAGPGVTPVSFGAAAAACLGASPRAARGRAIQVLAQSLAGTADPLAALDQLQRDPTPATALWLLGLPG